MSDDKKNIPEKRVVHDREDNQGYCNESFSARDHIGECRHIVRSEESWPKPPSGSKKDE